MDSSLLTSQEDSSFQRSRRRNLQHQDSNLSVSSKSDMNSSIVIQNDNCPICLLKRKSKAKCEFCLLFVCKYHIMKKRKQNPLGKAGEICEVCENTLLQT